MNNKEKLQLVKLAIWEGAPEPGAPLNMQHFMDVGGQEGLKREHPERAGDFTTLFKEMHEQNRDTGLGTMPDLESMSPMERAEWLKEMVGNTKALEQELLAAETEAGEWNPTATTFAAGTGGGIGGAVGGLAGAGLGHVLADKLMADPKNKADKKKREKKKQLAALAGAVPGGLLGGYGGKKLSDAAGLKELFGYKDRLTAYRDHAAENYPVRT